MKLLETITALISHIFWFPMSVFQYNEWKKMLVFVPEEFKPTNPGFIRFSAIYAICMSSILIGKGAKDICLIYLAKYPIHYTVAFWVFTSEELSNKKG